MKYSLIVAAIIVVVGAGYLFVTNARTLDVSSQKTVVTPPSSNQWEGKTDSQGAVAITVTPKELGKEAAQWKFGIVFTTHNASLDQDPVLITTLVDDKGNSYTPVAWEGAAPGGHHREGVLVFNAVSSTPAFVEIQIRDVGGIPMRSFNWNLP